jgi:hypothetical protein
MNPTERRQPASGQGLLPADEMNTKAGKIDFYE